MLIIRSSSCVNGCAPKLEVIYSKICDDLKRLCGWISTISFPFLIVTITLANSCSLETST